MEVKKLPNIIHRCMTIGAIPTSYKVSLTYEEQLMWFCKFLEDEVIPVVNNNSLVVEELKNWFDNLDVQEEINNKLDEMAESGELEEIIAEYLELVGLICFNTLTEMKNADNLKDGSFTKTAGTLTYNDGKGEFYKVRQLESGDVIDEDTLVGLTNYPTLVAEKLIDGKIEELKNEMENQNPYFNLKLQPNFYYDDTQNYNLQGCTVDINNVLYQYNQNNYPYGDVLKFDMTTKQYIGKISSVKFYHANDMCNLNNKLYVASCRGESLANYNRKIVIYDLTNNTTSEINPFDNYAELYPYVSLIGISVIDSNTLLCVLTKGGETFNELLFVKYNLTTEEVTEISISNPKNLNMDYYYCYQASEYIDGNIYVMTSSVNSLMKFKLEGNAATLDYIFTIPNYDNNGVSVGETEGLTKFPTELFGKGTLLVTSEAVNNKMFPNLSLRGSLINVNGNLPTYAISRSVNPYIEDGVLVYVNNTASSTLYEDGTETYPFKNMGRAIECVNNNKNFNFRDIRISGGDNYQIGRMINKVICVSIFGRSVNFIGDYDFRGCKVIFATDSTGSFTFKGSNGSIDNSNCTFNRATFEGKISTSYGSFIRMNDCTLTKDTDRAMDLKRTQCYLGITYTGSLSKPVLYSDFSTVILPSNSISGLLEQSGSSSMVLMPS